MLNGHFLVRWRLFTEGSVHRTVSTQAKQKPKFSFFA